MASKKKIKFNKTVLKTFTGTEVGALVEDFTSQVKLIAEQYGDIKKDRPICDI